MAMRRQQDPVLLPPGGPGGGGSPGNPNPGGEECCLDGGCSSSKRGCEWSARCFGVHNPYIHLLGDQTIDPITGEYGYSGDFRVECGGCYGVIFERYSSVHLGGKEYRSLIFDGAILNSSRCGTGYACSSGYTIVEETSWNGLGIRGTYKIGESKIIFDAIACDIVTRTFEHNFEVVPSFAENGASNLIYTKKTDNMCILCDMPDSAYDTGTDESPHDPYCIYGSPKFIGSDGTYYGGWGNCDNEM